MADLRPLVVDAGNIKVHTDTDVLVAGQALILAEQASAPSTPISGYGVIYVKTDGNLYFKNDAGIETLL